jgi:hypothetical protein
VQRRRANPTTNNGTTKVVECVTLLDRFTSLAYLVYSWGQSYKDFNTLEGIYKYVLKFDNMIQKIFG